LSRIEYIAEGITMYLGDCREILPTLGKVDHVICDPPYEKEMHFERDKIRRTDGHSSIGSMPFASIDGVREEAAKIMAEASLGWLLAFCTTEGVALWRDAIEAAGARYKRACVWIKPDAAPQFNGQGPALGHENIVTAWCGAGHSRWNGGGRRGVFVHNVNPVSREGSHPTEKPVSLMCELVTLFTNPGEFICDPFAGSGTTGIAAIRLGRKFVGVEKDVKWFDLSCRRLSDAMKQADMFVDIPRKVKQQTLDFVA
jgi:site-specific DNA-methyltransferase (adenine-specific)